MEKRLHSSPGQACLGGRRRAPWCEDQGRALRQPGLSNAAGPAMAGPQVPLGTEMNLKMMGVGRRQGTEPEGERERDRETQTQVRDADRETQM